MKLKLLGVILFLLVGVMSNAQKLHLYGGKNQDVYLGCLNCGKYDSNSIWNKYGKYGSKFNSNSIWNKYGKYGSKYNSNSPWNKYASNPPAVVDNSGKFRGYFTVNKNKSKRAKFDLALAIYEHYDSIRDDVGEWYSKIFD